MYATISSTSRRRVAELVERQRHGLVHDRDLAAADELLRLHQGEVRLDARRVAIHHEADRPGRREHRRLRVAVAVHLAEIEDVVPRLRGTPSADPTESTSSSSMFPTAARCFAITPIIAAAFGL